jgi:hypothetical protein
MKLRSARHSRAMMWVVGACVVFAMGLGMWLWMRPPPEPSLRGKSLTEWLILADKWDSSATEKAEGVAAVKEIGTNAIPYLL